jgi:uncharacterized membrane protein
MNYGRRMSSLEDEIAALAAQVAALTARVYRLERASAPISEVRPQVIPQAQLQTTASPASATLHLPHEQVASNPASPRQISRSQLPPTLNAASLGKNVDLEKKIGQYWLNWIGIVAILVGVSYFLKYAFENNWIGPSGRIAIGLLTGIGLVIWSESFRHHGHKAFSYSLKAIGIGTLYLSLWGACQVYYLIPVSSAFAAMVIVTGATIALALTQDAELLASFALVGGFATPMLLSTGQNHESVLFSYVCVFDLAVLLVIIVTPWRRLLWGSFIGTVILYVAWSVQFYSKSQRPVTVLFAALFSAIFAAAPLASKDLRSARFAGPSVTLTVLPLLNAAVFFLALYGMYEQEKVTLTWYALALAAAYLLVSALSRRRCADQDARTISLTHVAIAIAFITIAIPLKFDAHWITIGWLIESVVVLWVSVEMQTNFLRYTAIAALTLGIARLLVYDTFHTETLLLNARFATYLVAIAVLGGIVRLGRSHPSEKERPLLYVALVLLNLLALIALTREASDYFNRQSVPDNQVAPGVVNFAQLQLARDFTYSLIWLIYGAGLTVIGFRKRSAFVRWQSLILIAVTVVKVFLYDVSALDKGYRILSFVALGGALLGISFIYQRDWLKPSQRPSEGRAGTS